VVSVTRVIIGRLVVGREEARQYCLGGDTLCWEIVEPQEWCLTHHKGGIIPPCGLRCLQRRVP
jgi:hypothetical protein